MAQNASMAQVGATTSVTFGYQTKQMEDLSRAAAFWISFAERSQVQDPGDPLPVRLCSPESGVCLQLV